MIQAEQIGVFLPQGFLFKDVTFQVNKGDKIGLTGKNGAGKSTLLKLLSKTQNPSEGKIHLQKEVSIGFLTQDIRIDSQQTVYDYLFYSNDELNVIRQRIEEINKRLVSETDFESASYLKLLDDLHVQNDLFSFHDGYKWEEKIVSVLGGLGFSDEEMKRSIATFSGGWKMRAELAKILVNRPNVILLDEPTNHLDILSIAWLESYLQRFEGALILISHDRLFLDNVTNRTLEISLGRVLDFPYAYSTYKIKREEEMERLEQAKKQQDKDLKHTQELIDKFRAKKNKAAFAQSLIKKVERTERIEIERDPTAKMRIAFPLSVQPGKWILELHDFGKSFGAKTLFRGINVTLGREEKIALLGPNGVGKSTLLKCILNELEHEGTLEYGHQVNITYFAQNQAEKLDPSKTIYEIVDEIAVGEVRKDLRSILGAFLFSGEEIDKKVGVLSGGERTRLALCRLLLSPSNFLILDEPTNHLDIQSKEVLKQALVNYQGTFIVVSHDREFLDGLTNRIWDIDQQGLKIHHYGVKDYLKMKMKWDSPTEAVTPPVANEEPKKNDYEDAKEFKRKKNSLNNQIKKYEQQISELEQTLKELDEQLAHIDYSDKDLSNKVLNEYSEVKQKLDFTMHCWEQAMEDIENL